MQDKVIDVKTRKGYAQNDIYPSISQIFQGNRQESHDKGNQPKFAINKSIPGLWYSAHSPDNIPSIKPGSK